MINVGDTVLVTIPTYWPGLFDIGLSDPTYSLQQRLQQSGLEVLRIDAGALSYWGDLSSRRNLLITVRPFSSAFGMVQDVAGLVAGAAHAVGFDINASATGQVIAYAQPAYGQQSSGSYTVLQTTPDRDPASQKNIFEDVGKAIGVSATTVQTLLFGGLAIALVIVLKD